MSWTAARKKFYLLPLIPYVTTFVGLFSVAAYHKTRRISRPAC